MPRESERASEREVRTIFFFYHFEDNVVVRALCVLLWSQSQAMKAAELKGTPTVPPTTYRYWWHSIAEHASDCMKKPSPVVGVAREDGGGLDSTSEVDGDARSPPCFVSCRPMSGTEDAGIWIGTVLGTFKIGSEASIHSQG